MPSAFLAMSRMGRSFKTSSQSLRIMRSSRNRCSVMAKFQAMEPEVKQPPRLGRSMKGLPAQTLLKMAFRWGLPLAAAAH